MFDRMLSLVVALVLALLVWLYGRSFDKVYELPEVPVHFLCPADFPFQPKFFDERAATTATISGLDGGTTYYFRVAAVDAGGVGAKSAEARAMPTSPSGGGGAFGWIGLALLALLAAPRCLARPSS